MNKCIGYKALVRKRYPEAYIFYGKISEEWKVFDEPGGILISSGNNATQAWKNAYENMKGKP